MATEDELIGMVLDAYQAPGSGQNPDPEDVEKVRPYVSRTIDDVNKRLGVYIADSSDVPDAQALWLAVVIANVPPLARFFGVQPDANAKAYAERMLGSQQTEDSSASVRFVSY